MHGMNIKKTYWFYNRDGMCLLRGTGWIFSCNSAWRVLYEPYHGSCDERFEVAKVAMAHVFLRVLPFCPVSISLFVLCTHLHIRRANGRNLGTFPNAMLLRKSGIIGSKSTFICFVR